MLLKGGCKPELYAQMQKGQAAEAALPAERCMGLASLKRLLVSRGVVGRMVRWGAAATERCVQLACVG